MATLERFIIDMLIQVFSKDEINAFLNDERNTATLIGALIAISGALLGTFLLLRGMALTSDAISHTVLLGIVVAFIVMTTLFNQDPDISSPWLIIGAAFSGVATVILTEIIYRSGLVKQDAALGLAFPLLFAIAIILVSRYTEDIHLDEDTVMVGEIGVAWADTNSHCFENCNEVIITPEDERANVTQQCINCRELGISPRDEGAEFIEICTNCETYSPARAYQLGLSEDEPITVFWPRSITTTSLMALLSVVFVTLFYKELKLSTFDESLAKALGFKPGVINYALMVMVSLVSVGAFEAVGSILVIAFFIIPPAAAYLLTDRLSIMLVLSAFIGSLSAYLGYDLARGDFLGILHVDDLLKALNNLFDLGLTETWRSSISASIVLMMFFLLVAAWVFSPKYGIISTLMRRAAQRYGFNNQVVLGHIYNHQDSPEAKDELGIHGLENHFHWTERKMQRVLSRLHAAKLIHIHDEMVALTTHGEARVKQFRTKNLAIE